MTTHRVAILADIHGNMPALRAVLEDLERQPPDEILIGGDLVGRGPQGSAVVAEIRSHGWPCVRGNHEDYLLAFHQNRVPENWWLEPEWSAARWMAAELSAADFVFLDSLEMTMTAVSAPGLLLTHGTPRSHSEGLGPWTTDDKLKRLLAALDHKVLACAHTHRQMSRRVAAQRVVNVGSVGLPFNGDRRAQYAVFDWDGSEWTTRLRQVEYDIDEILRIYDTSGFSAAGGVTADLLRLEITHASPFLVPFLKWSEALGVSPTTDRIEPFLDLYDPGEPVQEFFIRLEASVLDHLRRSGR
ncbi:MAG: metallophosphoesterase family protein [Acidobacteriota bacterium]|nr:metallophosphoesterase family protein [Acidobacteriota bacterium]